MGVLGGGWTMESGGGQGRGGWIKESVNLVSVGGWVCVCVGVLSVGLGPGLDSMSPARSRRSASHAAGTHGWLPQKTGRPGLRRGGVGGYNLHSVPPNSPPDCGTVAHQPRAGCIRLVLTHYSSKPQRPSDSSRSWQRILLSGDVHPNPGPTTKYPLSGVCSQCYKSWGELFMQSLFWMGTFEVFWSSKRSRV